MHKPAHTMETHHYRRLTVMIVLSFVAMYVLMYATVDSLPNAVPNLNQFYMAGLMAGRDDDHRAAPANPPATA